MTPERASGMHPERATGRRAVGRVLLAVGLAAVVLVGCGAPSSPPTPVPPSSTLPAAAPPAGGRLLGGPPLDPVPAAAAGTATWSPWPAALHDARHSSASSGDGPTTGTVRWRRRLGGAATGGPVVGRDGTVYTASNLGVLHALDPSTGADRWTYASGRRGGSDLSTSALVMPNGTVVWGPPGRSELVGLSSAGSLLWTRPLPGRPTSPASVDGHRLYVGDTGGHVTALDVDRGPRVAWTVAVGTTSYGSVVTDGSGRIYTTADSALIALDDRGATAGVAWRVEPRDDITEVSAGLAPDGTALLGTNGSREWAYRRDGSPRWNTARVITYSSPAVTADGLAYVADHSGRVRVLDIADGAEVAGYQLSSPEQIWSSVAVDRAHRLYFATQDGHVLGAGPDGRVLFDVAVGDPVDSYPALTADGVLIVGDRGGDVVAIG
ncbi:hypothetical protein Acsp06_50820 [Actinomycetospora sp. NBRC 106375]|uniref:outer membrane protein assembly factor BamB family protein n=1 Tax=Actinomycetospora sp. NBRC 106375 TaxID=3032207 RepID=UPI0024A3F070|nr:PQQ-binding-like beta-propeller repeat protein [Actinomycetospora sp. NBRC 106375]GLZ48897.1 hypothetical protein Acsp06_50820 [Actinomycetospora sp. NBRC 106375]